MLGKLIKYDLKYGYKLILIVHTVLLIACIIGRFVLNSLNFNAPEEVLATSLGIFISLFTILMVGVSFSAWGIIAVRFYRNLFTDEGYLTWTLPATPLQHLWSKIISGVIWYTVDILLSILGLVILVTGENIRELYTAIEPELTEVLGMSLPMLFGYIAAFLLASSIASVIMIYACVAIGQLFPGHRVLGALIAYFIISFVTQIATLIFMVFFHIFPNASNIPSDGSVADYLFMIFGLSVFLIVLTAIPEYIATHYIMKKKINLL